MVSLSVYARSMFCALAAASLWSSQAEARVEAGILTYEVGEGVALIISSPRHLHCVFHKPNGQNEAYRGKLEAFGANIGVSGRGVISWAVLAATRRLPHGELAGSYGGVGAGGAAVVGARAQLLVGGNRRTISLQPLSVEGEVGVNLAVGITAMRLRPLFRGRVRPNSPRVPSGWPFI